MSREWREVLYPWSREKERGDVVLLVIGATRLRPTLRDQLDSTYSLTITRRNEV